MRIDIHKMSSTVKSKPYKKSDLPLSYIWVQACQNHYYSALVEVEEGEEVAEGVVLRRNAFLLHRLKGAKLISFYNGGNKMVIATRVMYLINFV